MVRRGIFISVLLLFFSGLICAQWREAYLGTDKNNAVQGISFLSPSTGFVAFNNYIGFTTDSGHSFVRRYVSYSNTDFNGYSVNLTFGFQPAGIKAFSQDSVFVYGDFGTEPSIIFSSDQGRTWRVNFHGPYNMYAPTFNEGITDLTFPGNSKTGYAIHHEQILKTTNRGVSWSPVLAADNQQLRKLSFPTLSLGFAVGKNLLLKTIDGGSNWESLPLPTGNVDAYYNNVFFLNQRTGYISENYSLKIFRTDDGGATWTQMNNEKVNWVAGTDMYFMNDSTGFICTEYGYNIYKTTDRGKVWERCKIPEYQYLNYGMHCLSFIDKSNGWAGADGDYLLMTSNGANQTIPRSAFLIDTTGESSTGKVKLVNNSKPTYQYKWYVNDSLISTGYNTEYVHNIYHGNDKIELIVSNGIDADTSVQYQLFDAVIIVPPLPYSGWQIKPTNLSDNLLDVRFFGNNGLVIGDHGMYVTRNGADDKNGWALYQAPGSNSNNDLLKRMRFVQLASDGKSAVIYVLGNDTVNHKAIILKLDIISNTFSIVYQGSTDTRLNSICYVPMGMYNSDHIVAVGDHGLVVNFTNNDVSINTTSLAGNPDLRAVFPRLHYYSYDKIPVAILSDTSQVLGYINGSFIPYLVNRLPDRMITGTNIANTADVFISQKKLYRTQANETTFNIDSISRIKDSLVQFNSVERAFGVPGNGTPVYTFLATNRGIYKLFTSLDIGYSPLIGDEAIEYQPTSLGKYINRIWFQPSSPSDTGYAVGKDGVLLMTKELGGPTIPYAGVPPLGNCLGEVTQLNGLYGSANGCRWIVDNNTAGNNCTGQTVSIANAGKHTVEFIVKNPYGLSDTSFSSIDVKNPPSINLVAVARDAILCKGASTLIEVRNSEQGFKYELLQENTNVSFGSTISKGGNLIIQTLPITQTGNFRVSVSSTQGGCTRILDQKLHFQVEHPLSVFNADKINAEVGEPVNFFAHSKEASTYHWNFLQDANKNDITDSIASGISFGSAGQKTLSLVSTTLNGCSDTLTTDAINIYIKPGPADNCYSFQLFDSSTLNLQNSLYKSMTLPNNDYMIAGTGNNAYLNSRYGLGKNMKGSSSTYLARYTGDGVLRWIIHSDHGGNIKDFTIDPSGNIYVVGHAPTDDYFYFPDGLAVIPGLVDSVTIYGNARNNGFILKLSAEGKLLWRTVLYDKTEQPLPPSLAYKIDYRNGNLLIAGGFHNNLSYFKNGISRDLFQLSYNGDVGDQQNDFVIKLDDNGNILWQTFQHNGAINYYHLVDAKMDGQGRVFVFGQYESSLDIYDVSTALKTTLKAAVGKFYGYLYQLDVNGKFNWLNNISNTDQYQGLNAAALAVDNQGSAYITGNALIGGGNISIDIQNNDGFERMISVGGYYLIKLDQRGHYIWSAGSKYAPGGGQALYVNDTSVFVAGSFSLNANNSLAKVSLISSRGQQALLPINQTENFIAQYDTSGVMKRIINGGTNGIMEATPVDLSQDKSGNILLSGSSGLFNADAFTLFNLPLNGRSQNGFIIKLNPDFCNAEVIPASTCPVPEPLFEFLVDSVKNFTVNFKNVSVQDPLSPFTVRWYFGDGDSSDQNNPVHTYLHQGKYTINMVLTSPGGCFKNITKDIQLNQCSLKLSFTYSGDLTSPATVTFKNTSPQDSTVSYKWYFGTGDSSVAVNPVYMYQLPGGHLIKLLGNSAKGCRGEYDSTIMIKEGCKGMASFTFSGSQNAPASISFQNTSSGLNLYHWSFGDGASSQELNPKHIYQSPGSYMVGLVAINQTGCTDTASLSLIIKQDTSCSVRALFSYSGPLIAPASVSFTNNSIGASSSFWDFGDGTTSTTQNPVHVFTSAGVYHITMIARSGSGCADTSVQEIIVKNPPATCTLNSAFSYSQDSINPRLYHFKNLSSGDPKVVRWDFGDGVTANQLNPSHEFGGSGTYTICLLTLQDSFCSNVHCDTINISGRIATGAMVYPNPATSTISCLFDQLFADNTNIYVYNEMGRIVIHNSSYINTGAAEVKININGLAQGLYFIKITSSKNLDYFIRFIKL